MTNTTETYRLAISEYCESIEADIRDIFGQCRKKYLVKQRHAIWYVLRESHGFTLKGLAAISIVGSDRMRDHTTILHGISTIEDDMIYPDTCQLVLHIREFFNSKLG
jgi:chromosomal replication initiation ATPase DnaA